MTTEDMIRASLAVTRTILKWTTITVLLAFAGSIMALVYVLTHFTVFLPAFAFILVAGTASALKALGAIRHGKKVP